MSLIGTKRTSRRLSHGAPHCPGSDVGAFVLRLTYDNASYPNIRHTMSFGWLVCWRASRRRTTKGQDVATLGTPGRVWPFFLP